MTHLSLFLKTWVRLDTPHTDTAFTDVFACTVCFSKPVLPPLSEQKVISQPSPDENALSISLNTLPDKTKHDNTHRSEHTD